jgi:hypothetical protein
MQVAPYHRNQTGTLHRTDQAAFAIVP